MPKRYSERQVRIALQFVLNCASMHTHLREARRHLEALPKLNKAGRELAGEISIFEPRIAEILKSVRADVAVHIEGFVSGNIKQGYLIPYMLTEGLCDRLARYVLENKKVHVPDPRRSASFNSSQSSSS